MTPQERIAAAIVTELRRQEEADPANVKGWIDDDLGTVSVCIDGQFDLEKVGEALLDAGHLVEIPPEWRCFHCDQVFATEHAARQHFGPDEGHKPACQIKASEGGLLGALREAEDEAHKAWGVVHSEGADGLQAYRANLSRHTTALRSAEEVGYARGLADHAATIKRLRRILHRYGDKVPMAMCHRPDWQQEIDDAMGWVADNPEPAPIATVAPEV